MTRNDYEECNEIRGNSLIVVKATKSAISSCTMASDARIVSAAKAAQAVNALIPFCEKDQQFLLDVIVDYFDQDDNEG